ncbi:SGNH/GDSL hydrolase family protein [Demequina aestuarii]|uniref:SGNH/GDSL hydrolase family protein n=1 Tax=Demequina aestuarii TaxID=327095 RepID=UPI0007808C29|nr:SGNH/GDSL hydrolase family protein [Demequina aestuarii]
MRFAAIGDSFTEGVGDQLDGGSVRGWADLVAAGLAQASEEPVHYANLAIRGRLIAPIVDQQLEDALALDPRPTLMTFNGGGNDMMRPGFGVERVMEYAARVADRCAEEGVALVVLSGGDPTERLPRGSLIRSRGNEFLEATRAFSAERPDVTFVDNWSDAELRRSPYWAPDRLHLNSLGHSRVAARVLTALGVATELPEAGATEDPPGGPVAEARYYATYVLPWLARRVARRSSGDGREPKHPHWSLVDPVAE